jgi:hypothetical protein
VLVAFLGYALWVTLKHLQKRRPAIVPQPSGSGVDDAQPFSSRKELALLSTLQSGDNRPSHDGWARDPTAPDHGTYGRKEIPASPTGSLPERLKSLSKCSADSAIA